MADLLVRDKEDIAHTETLDTGKTLVENRIDVDDVVAVFRYYADMADKDPGRVVDAGNGLHPDTESGPLVSAQHRDKIEAYVASAIDEGARLVAGGRRPVEPDLQAGFFYRPTVFAGCHRDMRVIREETFGPILR